MKYKEKRKDCHLIIRARTSIGETIDANALNIFSNAYLRGFLQPTLLRKNLLEYQGPIGISLAERMKRPINSHDFLFIIEQIVVIIRKINLYHMTLEQIILDIRQVYINEVTKEIQFLYVPLNKPVGSQGIIPFIDTIIYSAIPAESRDGDCIARFAYFMKGQKFFSPDSVEKIIESEDHSVVSTLSRQNMGQSGFMTDKPQNYYKHYEEKDKDDDATSLLQENDFDDEATGILQSDYVGYQDSWASDGSGDTTLLTDDDSEGTTLLAEEPSSYFPTLLRVLTDEIVSVNKPVFRVGKERSYVDYFVSNNNAVSRSHADIVARGSNYYVIDLNSKNHTYINDQMIPVQVETEIRDGDRLRLGNEEFIFHI